MKKAGLDAFINRRDKKDGVESDENEITTLNSNFEKMFKANKNAWTFFIKQAPSYQKTIIRWVMSAKQESTRSGRLKKLISASEDNTRLY